MSSSRNFHWIWPRHSVMRPDGTLRFKSSGLDEGESHWSSEEEFPSTDVLYPSMRWIFENRRPLPILIERNLIPAGLAQAPRFAAPPDGLYVADEERLFNGWGEALELPVNIVDSAEVPQNIQILMELTGGNCFLFVHGVCELAISVGVSEADGHLLPAQGLHYVRSTLNEIADTRASN